MSNFLDMKNPGSSTWQWLKLDICLIFDVVADIQQVTNGINLVPSQWRNSAPAKCIIT